MQGQTLQCQSSMQYLQYYPMFCRFYIFNEPIDRMGELMDLNLGLGPHDPQFLEAPMLEEELEILEEIIRNHLFKLHHS